MSKSINKVTLIGRVGKDPEALYFQDGSKVVSFPLATSTGGYKTKDGKDIPEVTQWHRIKAFGSNADIAEKYIRKGDMATIFGSIRYSESEKDGKKSYFTDIVASEIVLSGKQGDGNAQPTATAPVEVQQEEPNDGLPF